jgi:hypothetical protein
MKRKSLYALALLLFLSTIALSNERTRFRCGTAGNLPCATATSPEAASHAVSSEETSGGPETHLFLHTLIKLLYI